MALLPKVKLKAVVSFPATILDGVGVDVVKQNGIYQFNIAFDDFAPPVTGLSDPTNQNVLVWNSVTNAYVLVPTTIAASATASPLTKVDDTNVTLTLSGAPATALLQATTITAGWTGTLSTARGGLGMNVSGSNGVPLFAGGVPTFTGTDGTGNFVRVNSPMLTGDPKAPTASPGDNDTSIATTAFVTAAVASVSTGVISYNTRTGAVAAIGTDVPLRSYLAGLTISTAGSSATFGIAAGVATDSGNAAMMSLASAYTKTTGAWAVGSGNGALDTGSIGAASWYHVFLIRRPDTGVIDVLVSLSATAPTLPASYTQFRRIGSMKTAASQWTKFIQEGDEFLWDTPVLDAAVTNPGTVAVLRTLTVPPGFRVKAKYAAQILFVNNGTSGNLYCSCPDQADVAPGGNTGISLSGVVFSGAFSGYVGAEINTMTDTSARIRTRIDFSDVNSTIRITTVGWIDRRGRDA